MKIKLQLLWLENKGIILFLVLMVTFRSAMADWNSVPTGSMQPTIIEGDRIWVNKLAYDVKLPFSNIAISNLAEPERGDIVVFNSKVLGKRLVKRVVALPGDTVEMKDNNLLINGQIMTHKNQRIHNTNWINAVETLGETKHSIRFYRGATRLSSFAAVRVPKHHLFVLGDSRDNSADSRVIGFIPRTELVGRAEKVVMSLNYENYYFPRSQRFMRPL